MSTAVKILPAEENHLDEVNQFLIKHFFSREPLGLRLGISPAKDTQEWISQVTLPLLNQNVSSIENTTELEFWHFCQIIRQIEVR